MTVLAFVLTPPLDAQWPRYPNGTVPRTPDGKVDDGAHQREQQNEDHPDDAWQRPDLTLLRGEATDQREHQ